MSAVAIEVGITEEMVLGMAVIVTDRHAAFGDTSRNSRARWQVCDTTIDQRIVGRGRSKREAMAEAEAYVSSYEPQRIENGQLVAW